MEALRIVEGIALPIARANVDTDQILPGRYLQKPRANDFGTFMFRDLRFRPDGTLIESFVVNLPAYRNPRIIVAGRNFACGSSREHAVWALHDYGIRVAIAPSFGDIFASNSIRNGFLPVVLGDAIVARVLGQLDAKPGARMSVDLDQQIVIAPDGTSHPFEIDPFSRHCLLNGLDEIGYTLTQLDRIVAFENGLAAACVR